MPYDLAIDYSYWTYRMYVDKYSFVFSGSADISDDIISSILPTEEEPPSGFTIVGHIGEQVF